MNGYLVVCLCNLDDFPILLTADKARAELERGSFDPNKLDELAGRMNRDVSGPVGVTIWEFRNGRFAGNVGSVREL